MGSSLVQRAFTAGELAPALAARADLAKYISGLRTCRNFVVQRHGGAANRAGFKFVGGSRNDTRTYLFPFIYPSTSASVLIEAGEGYFRFWRNGARITVSSATAYNGATAYVPGDLVDSGGTIYYCKANTTGNAPPNVSYWHALVSGIYEIPTPYSLTDFADPSPISWSQAGTTITITHELRAPMELTYSGPTSWRLTAVSTAASIAAPGGLGATAGAVGTKTYSYVVTTAKASTYEESAPSSAFNLLLAATPTDAAPNALTWTLVAGAAEYYVYSDGGYGNGVYGFLGTAAAATFKDVGQVPDFGRTPPIGRVLFTTSGDYPAVSVTHQQRRFFARTTHEPEAVWASRVGFRNNFNISSPLQDDDAIAFSVASNLIQPTAHLIGLNAGLVLLTPAGEWVVTGDEADVLRPTSINPRQHAYTGASSIKPVVIGNSIVYVQQRGSVMRDLRFDQQVEAYQGRDLSLYAAHLFKGTTLVDIDYAQVPDSIVWAVRSDGVLLGLTYIRDEDVWGWHRHDTDGSFEQVCVLPEGAEDVVYVVVKRTIGGIDKRYIERLASRQWTELEDAFHVDSGVTYSGTATPVVDGLDHLEGEVVYALADGVQQGPFTVASGEITLTTPAATVHAGLRYTQELETLDLDVQGSAIRDKKKRVVALSLLLEDTVLGFKAGPDAARLFNVKAATWESATAMRSDQVEVTMAAMFTNAGRVLLRHQGVTPVTVLGILPHVEVGG